MSEPKTYYTNRLVELKDEAKRLRQKRSILGVMRFGTIAIIIAACYFLWLMGWLWVIGTGIVLLVVFVRLVYTDLSNRAAINHNGHLINIVEAEITAISGSYFHFNNGAAYLPKEHAYATDLDIFGHASVYQLVNRTTSEVGSAQLAQWLLIPAEPAAIKDRQEAISELRGKTEWRQELQAYGSETVILQGTVKKLMAWILEPTVFLQFRHWKWLRYLLPAIILLVVGGTIAGMVPMTTFYLALLIYAVIAYQVNKIVSPLHDKLSKIVDEIDALSSSAAAIEKEKFSSSLMSGLQQAFLSGGSASVKIRRLKKILERLDLRYNFVLSAPLNILLLWNLQQALDLEAWKKRHGADVEQWFTNLGIIEALNSFAAIHFNHPGWVFPELHPHHFFVEAAHLGHPLINEAKRVNNAIKISEAGDIMLVTGSNMAGKSTYLRSVGVNVVLAMAGSVVCATFFKISPVQLISSMRISDNLEESTSTFYAELKKLKLVIEKVNNGEKVFILLDEILRGTNSFDRHTGSEALIRQLIRQKAAGILATHDLALAKLEQQFPGNILNYHFDVQVNQDELYFDYKLKPGVCTSLNASILMRKIGIEL